MGKTYRRLMTLVKEMTLNLYQKFLYRETFCTHRKETREEAKCKHPYGFATCDLDICPIVLKHFANIVFTPQGIQLMTKKPKDTKIGGLWEEEELDIKVGEENNREEIITKIKEKIERCTKKNENLLIQRIKDIFQRYTFLSEHDNLPGILGGKQEKEAGEEEEEVLKEERELFKEEREDLFEEDTDEKDKGNEGKEELENSSENS